MTKHGKNYLAAKAKVEEDKLYPARDAVALAKETSFTKCDATVEVHMRMGLDPRQADQQVRDVVVLPHGLGKTVRVLVFAQGDGATAARSAGAEFVADDDETLNKIQAGWTDFDVAIATPKIWPVQWNKPKPASLSSALTRPQISTFRSARLRSAPITCMRTSRH